MPIRKHWPRCRRPPLSFSIRRRSPSGVNSSGVPRRGQSPPTGASARHASPSPSICRRSVWSFRGQRPAIAVAATGSRAGMTPSPQAGPYPPESGPSRCAAKGFSHVPRADPSRCSKFDARHENYSISSSALASNADGTDRPSGLAILRLMTSANLVGSCTGRSAGFAPLRMRTT